MINTILTIETGMSTFEDARLVRVLGDEPATCVGDLYDCEFIVECDGERYRIYGWNADSIEEA